MQLLPSFQAEVCANCFLYGCFHTAKGTEIGHWKETGQATLPSQLNDSLEQHFFSCCHYSASWRRATLSFFSVLLMELSKKNKEIILKASSRFFCHFFSTLLFSLTYANWNVMEESKLVLYVPISPFFDFACKLKSTVLKTGLASA